MSISSVNSTSSSSSTAIASSSGSDSDVSQLESQKAKIQQEITKEEKSSDDAKTKLQKEAQYQAQIQQIETKIQQLKAASNNTDQSQSIKKTNSDDSPNSTGSSAAGYSSTSSVLSVLA
jgi:chromosome segregation ATPase